MTTKMRFEMMKKALPFAAKLVDSPVIKEAKSKMLEKKKEGKTGDMMLALLPSFLEEEQQAVFGLIGALHNKTAEEIETQEWEDTAEMIKDMSVADDLLDFFLFSVHTVRSM